MNILQILPELNVGGVETGVLDVSKYLVRMGHKSFVVSAGGALVRELESSGAVHYTLPVHVKSGVTMIRMVSKLARVIRQEKIDVVHARSRVPAWIAYFACRSTGTPFITTCHGYYGAHWFSGVMGWGKKVIAPSMAIARHMIDDFGVPRERVRLIPRSVDLERFTYLPPDKRKPSGDFNIGIIGRITPLKGHTYFIKAMAKVVRNYPQARIWIVGDAAVSRLPYKEELQLLTRRLGLSQNTQFLGTQRDIPAILSNLNLLVLPTVTHEAFGRVLVEAQASGVPVIGTEVGGIVDIIDNGVTGLLVPPADPAALAEAVLSLIKDPARARSLAENAYRVVKEKYPVDKMLTATLDVYKEALSEHRILVVKLGSVGDVILSSAGIRAIRERYKDSANITCLTGAASKDALLRCPYLDHLMVVDRAGKDRGMMGLWKIGVQLRKRCFDTVIDLQNNKTSHMLAWLSAASRRYGYDNKKWSRLLNCRVSVPAEALPPVDHQFRLLAAAGIESYDRHLEIWPSDDDAQAVQEALSQEWIAPNQKLAGINVSASLRWQTKRLPAKTLARLCEELGSRDIRPVLTGTQADQPFASSVASLVKNTKVIDMCGRTTINELACLIRSCAVFISGDSAPLHVAAAVGTPVVAIFGPTDSSRHMPPVTRAAVIRKNFPCVPCYRPKCRTRKCMVSVTPEEIVDAVIKLMQVQHKAHEYSVSGKSL